MGSTAPEWTWAYEGYDPAEERLRESLCTLGNGYFATRGALPECAADTVHSPGTYAAGCYNRLESEVAGLCVENEDLVNLPNWLPLRFRPSCEDTTDEAPRPWFSPDTHPPLDHQLTLDLRTGILERTTRYVDDAGRHLAVRQLRLVHMGDPHLAALRTEFTAEDWSGRLEVESA
ncbi:glycoside hydrolase family 65 protein, partial [Streptomyces milbemycinicus]